MDLEQISLSESERIKVRNNYRKTVADRNENMAWGK
jgi:hypothetical protein